MESSRILQVKIVILGLHLCVAALSFSHCGKLANIFYLLMRTYSSVNCSDYITQASIVLFN